MFSENFLSHFVPTKVHHSEPISVKAYANVPWSIVEKQLIIQELETKEISQSYLAKYLQVNVKRIEKLLQAKRNNIPFSDSQHRPSKVDAEAKATIKEDILKAKHTQQPLRKLEIMKKVVDAAAATEISRGGNGIETSVCRNTMLSVLDEIEATFEKGQKLRVLDTENEGYKKFCINGGIGNRKASATK